MKFNLKIIYSISAVLIVLTSLVVYADSNGVWTNTKDIRPGTFGTDEDDSTSPYIFVNPVRIENNLEAQAFYYISDKRSKEKIEKLNKSVDNLNPVKFSWKNNGETTYGFIAQEVEENYPEIVKTNSEGLKTVEYNAVIPMLVKEIQELKEKVKEQEEEIKKLTS